MTRHDATPDRSRKGSSEPAGGALGVAAALAVCCGAKVLLLGGLAAGAAGGLTRWWPLLAAGALLVAWALWRRARRHDIACAVSMEDPDHNREDRTVNDTRRWVPDGSGSTAAGAPTTLQERP
jgi:hypothetical protein